jgi:transcriptional regulator with XRE-family HTH domain
MQRERMGLSKKELATKIGVDPSMITYLESGVRLPSLDLLLRISDVLRIPEEEIILYVEHDRIRHQRSRIKKHVSYLPVEVIESIANRDRIRFLNEIGRDHLSFPQDRKQIPKLLAGLETIDEDERLFSENDQTIYAGLFPDTYSYRGTSHVIAVATQRANRLVSKNVSEKTMTFQTLHELGHYQLHWKRQVDKSDLRQFADRPLYCSYGDNSRSEIQANIYASSFLLPREEVLALIGNIKKITIQRVRLLCSHFYVESWMLKLRLRNLGIMCV